MAITIRCAECGKGLKVKDESAGKKVKCPGCGAAIAVPRQAVDDDESPPPKPPRQPVRPAPSQRADDKDQAPPARPRRPVRRDDDEDEESERRSPPRRPASKPKQGKGAAILQTVLGLLILAGGGFALWWFVLSDLFGGGVEAWKEFQAPGGAFKVLLPGTPVATTKTTANGEQHIYTVQFPKLRAVFAVSYMDLPVKVAERGAEHIIEDQVEAFYNTTKRLKSKGRKRAWDLSPGVTAGEATLVSVDEGTLHSRYIMVKQRMYVIETLAPSTDKFAEMTKKILDSFQIVGEVPDHFAMKKDQPKEKDKEKEPEPKDKEKEPVKKDDEPKKKKDEPPTGGADFKGHTAEVEGIALSLKGDRLATVSRDGTLRVWEYPSGKQVHFADVRDEHRRPNTVAFAPDGQTLAIGLGGPAEKMLLYDLAAGKTLAKTSVDRSGSFLGFSPDGQHLVFANRERAYRLDPKNLGKPEELGQGRTGAISADSKFFFASRGDDFQIFDLETRKQLPTPAGWPILQSVNALALSGDGSLLALSDRGKVHFWDPAKKSILTGKEFMTLDNVGAMALSAKGELLAVRNRDAWQVHALPGGKVVASGKTGGSERILLAPDNRVILNRRSTVEIHEVK